MGCSYLAMKPIAPLLALPCSGMKPPSPLRAMKGHFCAISTLQRCCRFQWGVQRGVQRCWWFQSCPVIACYARNSSPYAAWNGCVCEIVRPASPKRAKNAVFRRAGRVFSRKSHWKPRAGRSFSRKRRGRAAECVHGERAYARRQSLWPSLISRGPISHAIPLKVFQIMNSNR